MVVLTQDAFTGTTNSIPYSDDFENYTNGTPLIDGTNGWYGSSNSIIVQTTTIRTGTNAAMIAWDSTLSNRFTPASPTNIWIQMDILPSLFDGVGHPVVNTNMAAMFYINTDGYFVVHNGPADPGPSNSANWVVVATAPPVVTNVPTWVRINIYEDFANTNWALYADGTLVTNNIAFINPILTNFTWFDIYNGATTSYLDNVSVTAIATNEETELPLLVIPPAPSVWNIFAGETPSVQTAKICNVWEQDIGFEIEVDQAWISVAPMNSNAAAGTTTDVVLTYADLSGWPAGAGSNAVLTVVATNGTDYWNTQTVAVVINVMELQVTPPSLTNPVWVGQTPTSQTMQVMNAGAGSFTWTANITNQNLVSCSPASGVLGAFESSTLTLNYSNTTGWAAGTSNTTITIASSDSGGATGTVAITLIVQDIGPAFQVTPGGLTNSVWIGDTPTSQQFEVSNTGAASLAWTVSVTNKEWVNCSSTSGVLSAGASDTLTLNYSNTAGWAAGVSNTTLTVATTNGGGASATVQVKLNVVQFDPGVLKVEPATLVNTVGAGETPASQTFAVINTGAVSLAYTVTITGAWLNCSSASGAVDPNGTNTLSLSYVGTASWPAGSDSNTTVSIVSINGTGATGDVAVTLRVLGAGITNIIPYTDDFEAYAAQMALVGGVSGWYGSASSVLVQDEIRASGTKAAMIPSECTLSNSFVAGTPFNVRLAMDLRMVRSDCGATNFPAVNTNVAALFYVNTNGHFVVCNGLGTTSAWCAVSNAVGSGGEFVVTNDTWVNIVIYLNYRHRNWKLKANNILITNHIGFVTSQTNSFIGFSIYNGSSNSYVDNVSAYWWDRFKINGVLDHLIRSVDEVVPDRILGVLTNDLPAP
ncbi:MAG: hypothetical protein ABIH24_11585 [Verrucomicrobiota bacterium]